MFDLFKKKTALPKKVKEKAIEEYLDITPIAIYFKNETGITFDKQTGILKNKVTTFCRQRKIYSFSKLLEKIEHEAGLKQELIDYLTTSESFFYRELKQIKELVELVKNQQHHVDILCAPSATGEEPYSIAIAILEAGVPASRFNITGIDINSEALQKAKEALYKERNVRNLSEAIRNQYFSYSEGQYSLQNSVRSLVTFKQANLFDASFRQLGKFDFIFSRNMLIYFDKVTKLKAKEILENRRKNEIQPVFFGHADLF